MADQAELGVERTLVLLKPDAVARGLAGRITARFEDALLKIVGTKMKQMDADFARKHYFDLEERAGSEIYNCTESTWQFPAGVVKPGMRSRTVAVRETLAETGVHSAVMENLGSRLHPTTHVLCDYLLCRYVTGEARNLDPEENVAVAWIGTEELGQLIPPQQIFPAVLTSLNIA